MGTWFKSRFWGQRAPPAVATSDSPAVARPQVARAELDAAYQRGRREGAKRRRGSPLVATIGLIAVAAVALFVYLAVQNGSFSSGGAVVDQNLSNASQRVQAPLKNAASTAGDALENAGQNLKQRAGDQPTNP
jgi:hypothetical protein